MVFGFRGLGFRVERDRWGPGFEPPVVHDFGLLCPLNPKPLNP